MAAQTSQGLVNQGWKDSHDAIFHADGRLARVRSLWPRCRRYVYAAWRGRRTDHPAAGRSRAGDRSSNRRRMRCVADSTSAFSTSPLGSYVLALDGDKKPCRVRASNAGHALFAGIAFPERAPEVVRDTDGEFMLLRVGSAHDRFDRSPLQSDELSQRLGVAARQCADRRGICAIRLSARGRANSSKGCSMCPPMSISGACRS